MRDRDPLLDAPAVDEVRLMDQVQTKTNRDIGALLPMDPAAEAVEQGIDAPEEVDFGGFSEGLEIEPDIGDL